MGTNDMRTIRLLGTGANDWNADHACTGICRHRCTRAKALGGKNQRRYCSLFMEPDTLIDCTADALKALHEYHISEEAIRHLIITHGHPDHFRPTDILGFASRLPHPLIVYGNTMIRDALAGFRRARLFSSDTQIIASHISRCYVDPHDDISDALEMEGITLAYDGMAVPA